jgi:hypothetical protein
MPGTSKLSVPGTLVRRLPIIFCCARYARANRVSSALAKRAEAVGRGTQYLGEGKTTPSPPRFQDEFEQLTLGERIVLAGRHRPDDSAEPAQSGDRGHHATFCRRPWLAPASGSRMARTTINGQTSPVFKAAIRLR